MKILLDENLPKKLKKDFSGHIAFTVRDMGWNGKKNGILLRLMIDAGFEAFITFDKNLQYQQNFNNYNIPVLVLNFSDNTYQTLSNAIPKLQELLQTELPNGATVVIFE